MILHNSIEEYGFTFSFIQIPALCLLGSLWSFPHRGFAHFLLNLFLLYFFLSLLYIRSGLLFFPVTAYCLSILRYWFLYVILHLATVLKILLLLGVFHWFYWKLYFHFYVIAVIIHFRVQIAHLWLLTSFDNHKCFNSFLAFWCCKSPSVILEHLLS